MKCKICNDELKELKGLSIHLAKIHKYDNNQMKEYYDKYFKKENEGICYFCENESKYLNLIKGYHRICDSIECVGKTRATGTYTFLMYKYGLSEEDAKIEQQKRANNRGNKIKENFDKLFNDDPDFHKKRSHQTKEFWINKGVSEEESIKNAQDVMNMIHNKTWKKRRNNPELYQNVNTTQVKYWIKKGFTKKEAIKKIKERQKTFTLEKCIEKYGEEIGRNKYDERQRKWSIIMETKYKNGEYQKFSIENYSKPEMELMTLLSEKLKIDANYGKNQFFRYFSEIGRTFAYDFYFDNKIIEFNGDYWHCNPLKYDENYINKHKKMTAKEIWTDDELKINKIKQEGFEVLVVWEMDYKKNKEEVIQRCIKFLNNK
jgi:uncharacterized protein YaeQ